MRRTRQRPRRPWPSCPIDAATPRRWGPSHDDDIILLVPVVCCYSMDTINNFTIETVHSDGSILTECDCRIIRVRIGDEEAVFYVTSYVS
jgi:hypothetical protein